LGEGNGEPVHEAALETMEHRYYIAEPEDEFVPDPGPAVTRFVNLAKPHGHVRMTWP